MQEPHEDEEAIRIPYPRLPPMLLAFIVFLFIFIIFAFFMDQGLTGRFVIFTIVVAGSLLAFLAVIRPQRYVEVAGDRLTNFNGIRRRTLRLSQVVAVGFGSIFVGGPGHMVRGWFLDLMQDETSYGVRPPGAGPRFPRRKDLGTRGADVKHFMLPVPPRWSPPLFRLILPQLLSNPNVYIAPQVRADLERFITS